jgi:hypothetical protein
MGTKPVGGAVSTTWRSYEALLVADRSGGDAPAAVAVGGDRLGGCHFTGNFCHGVDPKWGEIMVTIDVWGLSHLTDAKLLCFYNAVNAFDPDCDVTRQAAEEMLRRSAQYSEDCPECGYPTVNGKCTQPAKHNGGVL